MDKHRGLRRGFDPNKAGSILVTKDGDGYVVIDGQQRLRAAIRDGFTRIHCLVNAQDLNLSDQSKFFLEVNQGTVPVNKRDQAHAWCVRGDAAMLGLREVLKKHGMLEGRNKERIPAKMAAFMAEWMKCPFGINREVVTELEADQQKKLNSLDRSLTCLKLMDRGKRYFQNPIIMGVAGIFLQQDKYVKADTDLLVKKLRKVEPSKMIALCNPGAGPGGQGLGFRARLLHEYVPALSMLLGLEWKAASTVS